MTFRAPYQVTLDDSVRDLFLKFHAVLFYKSQRKNWKTLKGEKVVSAIITRFLLAHRSEIENEYREVFNAIQHHRATSKTRGTRAAQTAVLLSESRRGVDSRFLPPLPHGRGAR